MEGEARMPPEPFDDLRVRVGSVVVEHDMDLLGGGHLGFDGVEEADELLMPVALHAASDDAAFEHVQRGEQRGGAVPLVVMGQGAASPLLQRQARLGAVERLDLAFLVNRRHDGMGRGRHVKADDVAHLGGQLAETHSVCGWDHGTA